MFSQGEMELESTLDRQLYYHGDDIRCSFVIRNTSNKTVKKIQVYAVATPWTWTDFTQLMLMVMKGIFGPEKIIYDIYIHDLAMLSYSWKLFMIFINMLSNSIFRPECFVTEWTIVDQSLNMNLHMSPSIISGYWWIFVSKCFSTNFACYCLVKIHFNVVS